MAHLVKKSSRFVDAGFLSKNSRSSTYCETRVNGNPSGHTMRPGDKVYFAETGYAIYAAGTIVETKDVLKVHNLEELFTYYQSTKVRSSRYWFSIANEKIFLQGEDFQYVSIFEYKAHVTALDKPIFLPNEFRGQSSYYKLSDDYTFDEGEKNFELSHKIPNALRLHLFNKWNIGYDRPMIDIDHFVPSSLGGPGNIEENLEIVGLSINRRKGNSVPRGVFITGRSFCEHRNIPYVIPRKFLSISEPLDESAEGKEVAKEIVKLVNSGENSITEIKQFYADVKYFHRKTPK